ncbi:galactokinase [Alloacidobacterium dinghuense]|uniref:Galactokinase n=1 Tax=Alloacidobacterium dinghuense TaxID=2763107 RepID=A0A7G8BGS6_9BACT|nr:galactokinase [Alloacidobacterium dinghuense]QNI31746.1 galactokinase [Alloacidobacterium dinghuense]
MLDVSGIRELHREKFGKEPILFLAPGRVNLIGEHTDYADGFVMPAAIDFATIAAISPCSDASATVCSKNFGEGISHALGEIGAHGSHHWSDYPFGVLAILQQEGIAVPGFHLTLEGDVPLGAGLSSSASIEVASMLAMLHVADASLPLPKIALLCQRAENDYVGAPCGIMDQFVSCCGAADHALLLDCRSLDYRLAPIPKHLSLVICNTMVKHSHAGGEYGSRRAEVEEGTAILQRHRPEVRLLRDATVEDLKRWGHEMPPNVLKRCRHIVTENVRTVAAADALEANDLNTLGRLMAEAHVSYRDDFEASCPEADIMVELANKLEGCVGARLTGGGFGGCTVNLVESVHAKQFASKISAAYEARTGIHPEIYQSHASAGAHKLEQDAS